MSTMHSMTLLNTDWWNWTDEVSDAVRVKGRIIKWVSKSRGREQLSIDLELGIGDDGYVGGQVTYDVLEVSGKSSERLQKGKELGRGN